MSHPAEANLAEILMTEEDIEAMCRNMEASAPKAPAQGKRPDALDALDWLEVVDDRPCAADARDDVGWELRELLVSADSTLQSLVEDVAVLEKRSVETAYHVRTCSQTVAENQRALSDLGDLVRQLAAQLARLEQKVDALALPPGAS